MGQYHKFMNFDKKEILEPSGLRKLMEWSYQRNDLLLQVEELMKTRWKGDRVLVIGDYVDEFYTDSKASNILTKLRVENKNQKQTNIYRYDYEVLKNKSYSENKIPSRYIYNHATKEYIDLKKQTPQWLAYDQDTHTIFGAKIHPLSLLLSCCNGNNGGDYFGKYIDNIGDWIETSNSIEFSTELLKLDYSELDICFDEYKRDENIVNNISNLLIEEFNDMSISKLKELKFHDSLFLDNEEKDKIISNVITRKMEIQEQSKQVEDIDLEK